jgi:TRAP-type C4-dicarboxylate transport system permease small subunit
MDQIIGRAEHILLILLLSSMLLIAFFQIILRNIFATGLTWGDPLVRNLVLWISFVGAALATREGKHIQIDLVSRWTRPRARRIVETLTHGFSFSICCLLTWASVKFIINDIQMKNVLFSGIPSWVSEIILPLTFGSMAFRYGLRLMKSFSAILRLDLAGAEERKR